MALTEAQKAESRQRKDAARQTRAGNVPAAEPLGPADDAYWNDLRDLDGTPFDPAPARAAAEEAARRQASGGRSAAPPATATTPPAPTDTATPDDDEDDAPRRDFRSEAAGEYPWLTGTLLDLYTQFYIDTLDPYAALAKLRATAEYKSAYDGIIRGDGSQRLSEREYHAVIEGYRKNYRDAGLNPDLFESRRTELIAKDIGVGEHRDRLNYVREELLNNSESVRKFLLDTYGWAYDASKFSDPALDKYSRVAFAMALDPNVGEQIMQRRIRLSQIGGEAAAAGFTRSIDRVEQLAAAGLDQAGSRKLFQTAQELVPGIQAAGRRYNEDDVFGIDEAEDALVFGDKEAQRTIQRRQQRDRSSFSRAGSVATSDGALTGLRPR